MTQVTVCYLGELNGHELVTPLGRCQAPLRMVEGWVDQRAHHPSAEAPS